MGQGSHEEGIARSPDHSAFGASEKCNSHYFTHRRTCGDKNVIVPWSSRGKLDQNESKRQPGKSLKEWNRIENCLHQSEHTE